MSRRLTAAICLLIADLARGEPCLRHDPGRSLSGAGVIRTFAEPRARNCGTACITTLGCGASVYHKTATSSDCTIYNANFESPSVLVTTPALGAGESYNLFQLIADCSSPGQWIGWAQWGACSALQGTGVRQRTRDCIAGDCPGNSEETEECRAGAVLAPATPAPVIVQTPAPVVVQTPGPAVVIPPPVTPPFIPTSGSLGPWSAWTPCDVTCGTGARLRMRACLAQDGVTAVSGCAGPAAESQQCSRSPCSPLGEWAPWGPCSASCGPGDKTRVRTGGGVAERSVGGCFVQACPPMFPATPSPFLPGPFPSVPSTVSWSAWTSWSLCSHSCGGGNTFRTRACPGGQESRCGAGEPVEVQPCKPEPCPQAPLMPVQPSSSSWGPWGAWAACSVSCGSNGVQMRSRTCGGYRGDECHGPDREFQGCGEGCQNGGYGAQVTSPPYQAGPQCVWTQWNGWSLCSATCGHGRLERERQCSCHGLGQGGQDCRGERVEYVACSRGPCSYWEQWAPWSGCRGQRARETRTRACINGHLCEGEGLETKNCPQRVEQSYGHHKEPQPPPSAWHPSPPAERSYPSPPAENPRPSYGYGKRRFHRQYGTKLSKPLCRPSWRPWASWSSCSTSCGSGWAERRRECACGGGASDLCVGLERERRDCDQGACQQWRAWSQWSSCSASCGSGRRRRRRTCSARQCRGRREEWEDCRRGHCPQGRRAPRKSWRHRRRGRTERCSWSAWPSWGGCSSTCGEAVRLRQRRCPCDACRGAQAQQLPCHQPQCRPLHPAWQRDFVGG